MRIFDFLGGGSSSSGNPFRTPDKIPDIGRIREEANKHRKK